ncbi:hypothetical protein [Amycolatopsis sp. WGS_07]|uniref:hypothetical protein n=1 Tax=Amycolatopsis sp. WGS_07 TaxID=3076764 RepID=UPI0038733568
MNQRRPTDNWNGECYTDGCTTTGAQGIPLWGGGGHRCNDCNDAIAVMAPDFVSGMTDSDAYSRRVRTITTMDADTLRREAAPYFARKNKARAAFERMADAMGEYEAREALQALFNARDLVTEITPVNWWAAYRRSRASAAGPADGAQTDSVPDSGRPDGP